MAIAYATSRGAGADHRRRGHDRRVAADGRPDRDEQRQPALDAGEARHRQDDGERRRHGHEDQPRRGQPDPGDLAEAEPRAEQHDPEAKDPLGREPQARIERSDPLAGEGCDDRAEAGSRP